MNELEHWISDKEALASTDELGKDIEHVEALMKKFDDFQKDVAVNKARLDTINSQAENLIAEGHTDSAEIQSHVYVSETGNILLHTQGKSMYRTIILYKIIFSFSFKALDQHWEDLTDLAKKKKKALDDAHQVQTFIR